LKGISVEKKKKIENEKFSKNLKPIGYQDDKIRLENEIQEMADLKSLGLNQNFGLKDSEGGLSALDML